MEKGDPSDGLGMRLIWRLFFSDGTGKTSLLKMYVVLYLYIIASLVYAMVHQYLLLQLLFREHVDTN